MIDFLETPVTELSYPLQLAVFAVRILLALGCGAAIGYERTKRYKEAGIRTHCIIAIASAILMILSKYGYNDVACVIDGTRTADPARTAAQIITGIGFLGAAVIYKQGFSIHGLTTAAGIWATSGIGMILGAGMYAIGIFSTALILVVLFVLHKFSTGSDASSTTKFLVVLKDNEETRKLVRDFIDAHDSVITTTKIRRLPDDYIEMDLVVRSRIIYEFEEINDFVRDHADIQQLSIE